MNAKINLIGVFVIGLLLGIGIMVWLSTPPSYSKVIGGNYIPQYMYFTASNGTKPLFTVLANDTLITNQSPLYGGTELQFGNTNFGTKSCTLGSVAPWVQRVNYTKYLLIQVKQVTATGIFLSFDIPTHSGFVRYEIFCSGNTTQTNNVTVPQFTKINANGVV